MSGVGVTDIGLAAQTDEARRSSSLIMGRSQGCVGVATSAASSQR